ncbi:MAG: sigma-54-dependent Fis family transcriptional regulator, partial [Candidatus Aegiribacteria sp.]|nr:sigma-54-dependent Fis family transcriptional regulator [Candidatus Aegiribacteria sp.]
HWPGNVRELENIMERAWVLCENNVILPKDLPGKMLPSHGNLPDIHPSSDGIQLDSLLENIEKHYIINTLKQSKGNRTLAARLLGLKRTTLLARINSLGIAKDTGRK